MEQENRRLRDQLNRLLATVRDNQQTLERFSALELELIGAGTLADLFEMLLGNIPHAFELDQVHLLLHDREGEVSGLLHFASIGELPGLHLSVDRAPLQQLAGQGNLPWLGGSKGLGWDTGDRIELPPQGSVAILPLLRQEGLIGCYLLYSANPSRYHVDSGILFLSRLAALVAVCLENALNRERLRHAGLTDLLTGVSNRRYFEQRLQEMVGHALRNDEPLACLFVDVDHFKSVNDRFGHEAGDGVLREVAQRLRQGLRVEDLLARYGGEEFVILLPGTAAGSAMQIAERVRGLVAGTPVIAGQVEISVTISIGAAELADTHMHDTAEMRITRLLKLADKAMYTAKQEGRNRVINGRELSGA